MISWMITWEPLPGQAGDIDKQVTGWCKCVVETTATAWPIQLLRARTGHLGRILHPVQ
jgi:hypothetical protein